MWAMRSKTKTPARHDTIVQGELPFLWPDENGSLQVTQSFHAPSNALRLPRLRLSPRAEVRKASRLLQSRSFYAWFSSKNLGAVGFGMGKRLLFEMWLSARLEICDFSALELESVIKDASAELVIGREEVVALLLRVTRRGGGFKSDGEIITFR